jgi:hypothetical protein
MATVACNQQGSILRYCFSLYLLAFSFPLFFTFPPSLQAPPSFLPLLLNISTNHIDHSKYIVPNDNKQPPRRVLKRTPSGVFSWPSFVTDAHPQDVFVPFKSLVQVRATDTIRSVLWVCRRDRANVEAKY